jgi:hypothetical protein
VALRRRRRQTAAGGHGLIGKSRKRDPGHDFDSDLAWEKESKEGMRLRDRDEVPGARKSGRWRRAVAELRQGIARARKPGNRGKKASYDAHLHAELRRRAGATKPWRSGETAAYPSLAAKAAARLGLRSIEAAATGCVEPRARVGAFIGQPRGLDVRAQDAAWRRPCRVVAGLGLEPESSSRLGTTPTGGPARWLRGGRKRAGQPAGPRGEERVKRRKAGWAWAAWKKMREGKEKEGVGVAKGKKREKKNCIQMHLNLNLKFKFK